MKTIALALTFMARYAHGANVDYSDNGESWKASTALFKDGKRQSPIDLPTKGLEAQEEEYFFKHYENVEPVAWGNGYGDVYFSKKSSAVYLTLDD